jgi:P27 family predicted phage terminase small subunit
MAGRRPKPTALKLIQGNPGKRPLNKDEPKPEIRIPRCPGHLSQAGKSEWKRISKELVKMSLLTGMDRAALAAYCQTYGRWVDAETKAAEKGLIVKTTAGNVIQNPYIGIANKALEHMYRFLTEFGLTPSSRTRLSAPKVDAVGKFDDL